VVTDKGEIATRCVINVAGPWGKDIAKMVGIEIPMKASRHPVIILERPPQWRTPTPVWGDLINGWYFKPERDAAIMVGSIRDIDDDVDIENHATLPSYEETETYSAAALKRFPVMESGLARKGWAGLYDVTPDWQPVIDRIPEVDGFYCAVGFSGHGFKIGPAVGRIMSELVVDGACKSYDIALFRYARFQEKSSSRGAYAYGIVG
jgi:sarcosine oxidase subunit beta